MIYLTVDWGNPKVPAMNAQLVGLVWDPVQESPTLMICPLCKTAVPARLQGDHIVYHLWEVSQ